MPKKDRDVWDPPKDRKMVEEVPSAFMQHFQDRAVRVGKDGSNAQLVRVKKTKPIQWSDGNNRNKEGRGSIPGPLGDETSMHKMKPMMLKLPLRNRSHVRGIVAPDEPKAIMPPRRLQAINHTICVESGNGLGRHTRTFFDAHVVNRMDAHVAPNPVMAISPDCRIENMRQTVAAATVMSPRLEISDVTSISVDKSQSPEVLSVECVDFSRPVKPIPFSRPFSDTMGLVDAGEGLRKSLARLPPRRISGSSGADEAPMMPRPKNTAVTPPLPLERNEKKNKKEDRNDVLSREDEVDDFSVQFEDDNSEFRACDSTDIPIYQPVGFMMRPRPGAVKGENKTSIIAAKKRNPSTGTRRPESENGACGTRQDYHLCTHRKKGSSTDIQEFATSVPVKTSGINSHPSRLQPLFLPLPPRTSTVSVTSSGALTETKESEQEEEKKKSPAYKSYNLKDYKLMMEQVTHLRLGGLGPADTDEQRQAKEKMHRQCQYGKLVEKKAVERIREKQQRRIIQKLKLGEGGDADVVLTGTPPNKMPQQPPPPERIQAKERRSRALDYARNLPRPEPPASRKPRDENSISTLESGTLQWRSQQDEAAWRREKRLKELEARHRIDRERVAAVKRQLGY